MFSLKSVVGKLWLTIIGLVAVVLLVLGLFLSQYIETSFPKSQDQTENLRKIGLKVVNGISQHMGDTRNRYMDLVNDVLSAQEAYIFIVDSAFKPILLPDPNLGSPHANARFDDFFSEAVLKRVFAGETVDNRINRASNIASGKQRANNPFSAVAVPLWDVSQQTIIGAAIIFQSAQSVEATQTYVMQLFAYVSLIGFLMTCLLYTSDAADE